MPNLRAVTLIWAKDHVRFTFGFKKWHIRHPSYEFSYEQKLDHLNWKILVTCSRSVKESFFLRELGSWKENEVANIVAFSQ